MLASLKVASSTSSTNSGKDIKMDYNQLKEKLSMLDPVLKGMNIKTLNISEDDITISLSCEKQETQKQEEPVRPKHTFKSRESKLDHSRKRLKDPRWIKIADTLHVTPKEWIETNYPDVEYGKLMSYMYRYKDKGIRECCESCRE